MELLYLVQFNITSLQLDILSVLVCCPQGRRAQPKEEKTFSQPAGSEYFPGQIAKSGGDFNASEVSLEAVVILMAIMAFSLFVVGSLGRFVPRRDIHRPSVCARSAPPSSMSMSVAPERSELPTRISRIVCIGDVHGQWDENDEKALRKLRPDLALFVGDYGNEDVRVTKRISELAAASDFGVATVFGNHDAFYTANPIGRRRAPYDKSKFCRVTEQMQMLAPYDVSYKSFGFDDIRLSVCGGRAFSHGGPNWKHKDFYRRFVGIQGMKHSAKKMKEAVESSQYRTVVFLSHSGPIGLGDKPSDPCGKDWGDFPGGDYGDTDLRDAIEKAREDGLRVPLTVFGHMHKQLMGNIGQRTMVKTEPDGSSGGETVMLNAAVVPRHKVGPTSNESLHHFQVVQVGDSGSVDSVSETWVTSSGEIAQNEVLYEAATLPLVMADSSGL